MGSNGDIEVGTAPRTWSLGERRMIFDQLERLLASPHFSHSKRYPVLFRYVVEQVLAGHADQIKERTLGVEVFGRAPDYDTTQDPIVRTTAGEIRKRIAQYYHDPAHRDELHIDLPSGTYVPEFEIPPVPEPVGVAAPVVLEPIATVPPPASAARTQMRLGSPASLAALLAGLLAGLLTAALAVTLWTKPWTPRPALDRFWAPVLDSPSPALLCVGQPHFSTFPGSDVLIPTNSVPVKPPADSQTESDDAPDSAESLVSLHELYRMGKHYVSFWDSVTITRVASLLEAKGKRYRIRPELSTSLSDLREGPTVLVGAFNNDWAMRLTGPLRFNFLNPAPHVYAIQDRQNPSENSWKVDTRLPYLKQSDDYAVISRVRDATTGRVIVVAGGVAYWGTIAAGEFLTDPRYMEEVAKTAPAGWENKNMQIVIGTRVIQGNCGLPRVLAVNFW